MTTTQHSYLLDNENGGSPRYLLPILVLLLIAQILSLPGLILVSRPTEAALSKLEGNERYAKEIAVEASSLMVTFSILATGLGIGIWFVRNRSTARSRMNLFVWLLSVPILLSTLGWLIWIGMNAGSRELIRDFPAAIVYLISFISGILLSPLALLFLPRKAEGVEDPARSGAVVLVVLMLVASLTFLTVILSKGASI